VRGLNRHGTGWVVSLTKIYFWRPKGRLKIFLSGLQFLQQIRELQTRTAVKIQGRGKKKIQLSAVQLGKHSNDMEEEDDEDMPPPHSEDKETRDESETKALRAQDWAVQLASLSPSQLHLAKRLVHWLFLLLTQGTKDRHWSVEKQLWNLVRLKLKLSHWFGIANLQSEWT
jgi:hypothetical protein